MNTYSIQTSPLTLSVPGGLAFFEVPGGRIIGNFIEKYYQPKDDDTEEEIARYVFRSFKSDDIKENLCSFTIRIDNHLSLVWDSVLTKHYGQPIDRKGTGNGKHWKHIN